MATVVAVLWQEKLITLAAGATFVLIGVVVMRFGAPLVAFFNNIYARLPGRWQYAKNWHRVMGGMFIFFGIVIAVGGGIFAGQST